jgi:cytochrome c biogenesis protein CcmG/thiol:disulfide interchange protein DsbE
VSREDLLGKVWMLNVWASWCAACRDEHPLLVEMAARKIVPIYGLNYKDTRAAGQQTGCSPLGDPYVASLFDADGAWASTWGVYGVPETFIIDRPRRDPHEAHRAADSGRDPRQDRTPCEATQWLDG